MCPLRIILIFLSATLAGFFVIRNLNSPKSQLDDADDTDNGSTKTKTSDSDDAAVTRSAKVSAAIQSGLWTCVDMASGRYLWSHLVNSSSNKTEPFSYTSSS